MTEAFEITRATTSGTDILDITDDVAAGVSRSGVVDGTATIFVPGSTAAVTTIELEEGVVSDLREAIERLAPRELHYRHDARWGDGNGYSHVRAALLGPSLTVPIRGRQLTLGTWQQIVLLDFDNRGRQRRIVVQVSG